MELQQWINSNPTYLDEFRNQGFVVKKKRSLAIVKYPYNYSQLEEPWKRICRGAVIDLDTHKVICVPPQKSKLLEPTDYLTTDGTVYELLDGTMVNMFWYKDQWMYSTRSDIGGNNRWNRRSIRQLFESTVDVSKLKDCLDTSHCYSFVLSHPKIRNVSPIEQPKVTLVEVTDLVTFQMKPYPPDLPCDSSQPIPIDKPLSQWIQTTLESNKDNASWKGITIKTETMRWKLLNPFYVTIKETLSVNSSNLLYKYIHTFKKGTLQDYISMYPEDKQQFTKYSNQYDKLCKQLLSMYHKVIVHKTMEKRKVPYHLKPLMYDLHKVYLQTQNYISLERVREFMKSQHDSRLVFVMNYVQ